MSTLAKCSSPERNDSGLLKQYIAKSLVKGWPLRGKRYLAAVLGLRSSTLPKDVLFTAKDGRRFRLSNDQIHLRLFLDDGYEEEETALFSSLCQPGDVVADIGANFGWYTTLFSRLVGKEGLVHAFEPSAQVFQELSSNVRFNEETRNVRLHRSALGDGSVDSAKLYTFDNLTHGQASLSTLGREDWSATTVQVRTLDSYLEALGASKGVHLIKLDVEGAEFSVVRGSMETLTARHNKPLILLEVNEETSAAFGYSCVELLRFLQERAGYDSFWVSRSSQILRLANLNDAEHGEMVVCASLEHHQERLTTAGAKLTPMASTFRCPVCGSHDSTNKGYGYTLNERARVQECAFCGTLLLGGRPTQGRNPLAHLSGHHRSTVLKLLESATKKGDRILEITDGPPLLEEWTRSAKCDWSFSTEASVRSGKQDTFDLIVLSDRLQRHDDPVALLTTLSTMLRPGGALIVSTPNAWSRYRSTCHYHWLHWNIATHRILLSPRSLELVARRAGYQVLKMSAATPSDWFAAQHTGDPRNGSVQLAAFLHPFVAALNVLLPLLTGDCLHAIMRRRDS